MHRLKRVPSQCYGFLLIFLFLSLFHLASTSGNLHAGQIESTPEYEEAVDLFSRGKYDEALDVFYGLFKEAPGNARVNFLLGRSAFEAGDYETAVFAFERILIAEPENQRARLEMARAYWRLGSLEKASGLFREVLDNNPPDTVRENIQPYLDAIERSRQRHFLRFSATSGINLDDNLNVSPVDDVLTIPALDDLPVNVEGEESGHYIPLTLDVHHRYFFTEHQGYWKNVFQTYHTRYPGHDDLEVDYFSLATGCGFKLGAVEWGVFPEGYALLLDARSYSWALGTRLEMSFSPLDKQRAHISGFIRHKEFNDIPEKDGIESGIDLKYSFYLGNLMVTPKLYYKRESADSDLYAYDRVGAGLSFTMPLPCQLNLYSGYYYEQDDYEGEDELFLTTRRDRTHAISAGLSRQFSLSNRWVLIAGAAHTWETVDANIALYEYDRNVTRIYFSLIY